MLAREEYIEQAFFFRTLRERLAEGNASQEVISRLHEEILSTTRLPMAIEFLAQEIRFRGVLHAGMARLEHYFTPFQVYVVEQAELETARFDLPRGLLILQRQAEYLAEGASEPGLFVYQFESLSRNRLGYDAGLLAISRDPMYDETWREWILRVRAVVGTADFADLLYVRSAFYIAHERRRTGRDIEPGRPLLFGEKEGRIAWANRGKDPLYLFAALQRQLGYPAVPRPPREAEQVNLVLELQRRIGQLEKRVQLLEGELKGEIDLSKFYVKPEEAGKG